jgi:hypothetical protein
MGLSPYPVGLESSLDFIDGSPRHTSLRLTVNLCLVYPESTILVLDPGSTILVLDPGRDSLRRSG